MRNPMQSARPSLASLTLLHVPFYTGFAFAAQYSAAPVSLIGILLGILLIWISVIDLDRFEIPDTASLMLALSGLCAALLDQSPIIDRLVAGVVWPLLFWSVAALYGRLRGWHGLGFGDVKLMVGIGLWLGLAQTTLAVLAAALAGIAMIVVQQWTQPNPAQRIVTSAVAFGPFLCLSTWVIWLF